MDKTVKYKKILVKISITTAPKIKTDEDQFKMSS